MKRKIEHSYREERKERMEELLKNAKKNLNCVSILSKLGPLMGREQYGLGVLYKKKTVEPVRCRRLFEPGGRKRRRIPQWLKEQ
jgi:hypothetical protein